MLRPLKAALRTAAVAALILTPLFAQESSEIAPKPAGQDFTALVKKLDAEDWAPRFFAGHVAIFDPVEEDRRLKAMAAEPYTMLEAGMYAYRISQKRAEEGRRLFFLYDFGTADNWRTNERYMMYALGALTPAELRDKYGYPIDERNQRFVGVVGMPSPDGKIDYGWSCALCHAQVGGDGSVIAGAPNHAYDGGRIRSQGLVAHAPRPDYAVPGYVDRDTPIERLAALGPGRLDRNADRIDNPVKIPSLWGLKANRSGLFANGNGANYWFALSRHNGGVHPSSEYMEALIAYLLQLEPPPNPRLRGEAESKGEEVFKRAGCGGCHSGPYYTNGEVIPIEAIGTDPARVRQEFPKGYRVPSLRRLDLDRLYLHDGSVKALPEMFSRARLAAAKGHAYGIDLTEEEKKSLVAFLLSL